MDGNIYIIYNVITNKIYIGSTFKSLGVRMAQHKRRCKTLKSTPLYQSINNYGINTHEILLLERLYNCTKEELLTREAFFINFLKPALNVRAEGRNRQQYYIDHKLAINTYCKNYHLNNKDKVNAYRLKQKSNKRHEQTADLI